MDGIDNWNLAHYFNADVLMMLYKHGYFSDNELDYVLEEIDKGVTVVANQNNKNWQDYKKNFLSNVAKWLIELGDSSADYKMPISKNASFKQIVKFLSYNDIRFDMDVSKFSGKNFTISAIKKETNKISDVIKEADKRVKKIELDEASIKSINKSLVDGFYAGKHGDIYPVIHDIYEIELDESEYEEWVKQYKDEWDNEIVPSFHGTGSVAANMISAFGFKVVKYDPETMTGRALGDGLYITNKIDKALLYASDEGYRKRDEFGYIFQLETLLGPDEFWRYDGPDTGGFLSPEWALKLPRKQTKAVRVMRVTAVPYREYKKLVDPNYVYDPTNESVMSFKRFINEIRDSRNCEIFAFRKSAPLPNGGYAKTIDDVKNADWPDDVKIVVSSGFVNIMFPSSQTQLYRVYNGAVMDDKTRKRFLSLLNKAEQNKG